MQTQQQKLGMCNTPTDTPQVCSTVSITLIGHLQDWLEIETDEDIDEYVDGEVKEND